MKEDYLYTIEQICKDQGKLSDDGDSWVDKYSGYIIRKISLNTDEEFTEEGYKNITRAVLEADLGESILQMEKTQKKFIDPENCGGKILQKIMGFDNKNCNGKC